VQDTEAAFLTTTDWKSGKYGVYIYLGLKRKLWTPVVSEKEAVAGRLRLRVPSQSPFRLILLHTIADSLLPKSLTWVTERARSVGLTLVRDGGSALLDREFEFPADSFLAVRLLEPENYSLEVCPGGGAAAALPLEGLCVGSSYS
jgi:hypothetical protein